MLITDGPPSSYRDIFKMYNWPHRPVRMFTYLIGKDTSSATDMHWMACANKGKTLCGVVLFKINHPIFAGYYTRISYYNEVKEKVLHYIEVMARPMVMYQNDHPIHWTSAYIGGRVNFVLP